jgi:1A family penicillin-binding protein
VKKKIKSKKPTKFWHRFIEPSEPVKNGKKSSLRSKRKLKKSRSFAEKIIGLWQRNYPPLLVALFSFLLFYLLILKDLPLPTRLASYPFPVSTKIFDRNGNLLYEVYAEKNRTPIKLEELPENLKWATIASEDKDFYRHHGFAFQGIFRAFYNIVFKQTLQGGSTITQQLVKNALLTPERTLRRKIREAILSWATEIIYSKDKILEMYFNQVPYGGTAWGIEAAAQTYFGKHAADLNLAEAALLAGLPASPTRFSPFGAHPESTKERQERVLQRMTEEGYISQEEMEKAKNEELKFASPTIEIKAPHFALWVKEKLVEIYGERLVEQGGLRVTTSLDLDLQQTAQKIVADEVAQLENLQVTNGAALITKPGSGEILAMIGSRDYFDVAHDGNVNVVLRPRQPGSSIKPLNYALAFEKKILTPASVINDIPICFQITGQPLYCPVNYDNQFHGPVQVRFALASSYNIPAVKTLALNGLEDFVNFAKKAGISTFSEPSNYGLSLTLGGGEVTMHDMAAAFSIFANSGIKQNLYAIEKIENWQGKTLFQHQEAPGERIISMEAAYLISHILYDNYARAPAFGTGSYLVIKDHPEVSVKTGTTNDKRDNWTIGFTPDFLVAVWVGNNDNSPMSWVASGVTGASPIWNQIMTKVLAGQEERWPLKPEGIIGDNICSLSGLKPSQEGSCQTRFEYFLKGTTPTESESLNRGIAVDKTTGQLATSKTPPENIEIQEHQVIWDNLGTPFCLDCPFPEERVILNSDFSISNLPTPAP